MSDNFFKLVGRTLGLLADPKTQAPADQLIKLNLSPVMGRRDASLDRAVVSGDVFSRPAEKRLRLYRKLDSLLEQALTDTVSILRMLSSPDTRRRELKLEEFLQLYRQIIAAVIHTAEIQIQLAEHCSDYATGDHENAVFRCESLLINEFRELQEMTRPRIDRYREYITKSFSPANLERYQKSYNVSVKFTDGPEPSRKDQKK